MAEGGGGGERRRRPLPSAPPSSCGCGNRAQAGDAAVQVMGLFLPELVRTGRPAGRPPLSGGSVFARAAAAKTGLVVVDARLGRRPASFLRQVRPVLASVGAHPGVTDGCRDPRWGLPVPRFPFPALPTAACKGHAARLKSCHLCFFPLPQCRLIPPMLAGWTCMGRADSESDTRGSEGSQQPPTDSPTAIESWRTGRRGGGGKGRFLGKITK